MGIGIERSFENNDIYTIVFVTILLCLTAIKLKYPKKFHAMLTSVYSKAFFLDYENELKTNFSGFKILLFLVQNLVFSVFFTKVYQMKISEDRFQDWQLLRTVFLGLTVFIIAKHLISLVVANIFNFVELFKGFHIQKFTYLKLCSLVMLPLLWFMVYSDIVYKPFLMSLSIGVFILLMALTAVFVVFRNNKVIIENLFYFIVYLCTLEIVPILLIFKIAVDK
ncbi:DUF4271 domain-containing protein [Flavicella sp.]|uniref:DUF4271 domain-containing protein n=1 Tax=Flavicella sp. TaxID=2957742 RepID=UPI0029DF27EB|nr:DUF4271 domain-containing protein [Flavicella sp.]